MTANDSLGEAVLALDVSGQGADLVVGASGENNGAGAVRIFEHNSQIFAYHRLQSGSSTASSRADGSARPSRPALRRR